jgi:benzoyl-CoA reductase/2-hydroxyglutaryl-CoA dehydratase subunit BcrC/BadD/HgdB
MSFRAANQPAVYKMIEDTGLATPVCLLDWINMSSASDIESSDSLESLVNAIYRTAPSCSSFSNVKHNVDICKEFNLDGAICFYPFSCRPYAINPLMIKKSLQEELKIPAIDLEYGGYDPREYTAGQMKTRVETFAELVKMRKAAQSG